MYWRDCGHTCFVWCFCLHAKDDEFHKSIEQTGYLQLGDYIAPDLITKFTDETGIEVQYETFDSNESMYTKIKQGGTTYDIAVPSDYMIDKMRKKIFLSS